MAVPTLNEFLERFPEFNGVSESVVQASIDEAARDTNELIWSDRHTDGIMWLAAHLCTVRQMQMSATIGQQTGTVAGQPTSGDLQSTLYGAERHRLWWQLPYTGIVGGASY